MGNAAALSLSVVLVAWAGAMRALSGTWLQPSAFFALWWCFAGILPLILAPNEQVGANAIAWVIAASVAVSGGAAVGNYGFRTRLNPNSAPATDRELLVFGLVVLISVCLGLGSNIAYIIGSNVAFSELLDIEKLVVVSNQLYVQRYAEVAPRAPPLSQALLPFVYLAPAAGGILFVLRREPRWKLLALFAFLPAVAVTILQTTKAAVLFALLFWFSGYFATRLRFGKLAVFTKPHLTVALGLGGLLTALFFAVSLARMASTDASLLNLVMVKLLTAAFGHMTVFSQWLGDYSSLPFEPTLGAVTFAGPLELLGYTQRIPGLFVNVIDLVAGETSNIYTSFRPLIQDFGMPGALAILALLGFVGGSGFRLVAAGRWSGLPFLLIAYYTTMWTPVTWFWIYNSLTATLVAVTAILMSVRLWRGPSTYLEPGVPLM